MDTFLQLTAAGQQFPAYLAQPPVPARGAVVVIHEIWGLNRHIRDIADRFAAAGYLALAPDLTGLAGLDAVLLAELGALRADPVRMHEAQPRIRAAMAPLQAPEAAEKIKAGVREAFNHLNASDAGAGRTAVVGFCFGGTYAFSLAVEEPRLAGAIPFYGHARYTAKELAGITCPVLAFYGEEDSALTDALPELIAQMNEAHVDFKYTVFAGAGHAFFNDSNPLSYRPEPAAIAWTETLEFLEQHLA